MYLVESGGADLPHQSEIFIPGGETFRNLTRLSGDGHPDDRHRVRQLDRRRRLRARHVRLRRDDRAALEGVPRRPAAGEDGDRRGERRREPRRRRHARPGQRPRRPLRRRRGRRAAHRPPIVRRLNHRKLGPRPARRRPAAAPRPRAADRASRRPTCGCRSTPATCWPASSTTATSTSSSPATASSLVTGWAELHGFPIGVLANHRGVLFNEEAHKARPVHPARQPDRHPAAVPAEHDRLHGRQGVRAAGHGEGRLEDDQRRQQLHRPPPHGQHGVQLRRRQLRHVRAGVRPPVPVHVAQRQDGRDGPAAAGRRAVDRRPPVGGVDGPPVRRGGRRRDAGRRSRTRSSASRWPCS